MFICSHANSDKVVVAKFCTWHHSFAANSCRDLVTNSWITAKMILNIIGIVSEKSPTKWAKMAMCVTEMDTVLRTVIQCAFFMFLSYYLYLSCMGANEEMMLDYVRLGLQGLYSATNCTENILGRFTIILQNQISRADWFTNLTKRWIFRFRLNASVSSHNLISFGKQFHARGPYTANARLPKLSCSNFGTFRTRL